MIIDRKYEWLGALYENDPKSKELIDEAFSLSTMPEAEKKRIAEICDEKLETYYKR